MKLHDAEQLAIRLMKEFGLASTWRFEFDNAKRRFGCCHRSQNLISLSRILVEKNTQSEVEDTIRHEIAHALCPPREGQRDNGGSIPTSPLQVFDATWDEAKPFIEKWHYSHLMPTGFYRAFKGMVGDQIYCIAVFGLGINPQAVPFLKRVGDPAVERSNLYELTRLCRVEPRIEHVATSGRRKGQITETYPLTQFLSICFRILKKEGIRFILAFSDPEQSNLKGQTHHGGIYKAYGFKFLGQTEKVPHVEDANGKRFHRRRAYKAARRAVERMERVRQYVVKEHPENIDAIAILTELAKRDGRQDMENARRIYGFKKVTTMAKNRWFIDLGVKNVVVENKANKLQNS
jgi:hypothetical protein